MDVGYVGSGWLATAAASRLAGAREIFVCGRFATTVKGSAARADSLTGLARRCNVVFVDLGSQEAARNALFGPDGMESSLAAGTIVVDQSVGDPDETRAMAARLAERGVVLLDAPIHCERAAEMPEATAILCGGPQDAVDAVRPLLEIICPRVVHCGDTGSGHAMRIVTGAVAACNRLVTYECAAIGVTNGVALQDLATVITQSSGYNSATARVLPVLGAGGRTADVELAAAAHELGLAARLARRTGAPMVIANLVGCLVESAAAAHGKSATLDALARIHERGAGIDFSRPS
ncbi:MAG: NAD(P)-dependent oxidoreductase [Betaproteobacteria bacterium]|nr:NAD(P)-dependent oxidoreductase [Betaproteobacteria bacterium]